VGLITNKMRGKTYHTAIDTVPKSDNKIKEEAKLTPTYMTPPSWLGTGASIKIIEVKLVLRAQTSPLSGMIGSCKYFSHVNKIPTLTYNRVNNFIYIYLEYYSCIFNLRDTEVVNYLIPISLSFMV
jgi:hypothetical protein